MGVVIMNIVLVSMQFLFHISHASVAVTSQYPSKHNSTNIRPGRTLRHIHGNPPRTSGSVMTAESTQSPLSTRTNGPIGTNVSTTVTQETTEVRVSTKSREVTAAAEPAIGSEDTTWARTSTENSPANVTEPDEEIHLNFRSSETEACFMGTENVFVKIKGNAVEKIRRKKKQAYKIYKEAFAMKGSIAGESTFGRRKLRGMSKLTNKGLRCTVYNNGTSDRYYLCCAIRVRVPVGLYVVVEISEHRGSKIRLFDSSWVQGVFQNFRVTEDNLEQTRIFVGSSNVVYFIHTVDTYAHYTDDRYVLRFRALRNPGLQVKLNAVSKGKYGKVTPTRTKEDNSALFSLTTDDLLKENFSLPPIFSGLEIELYQCNSYIEDQGILLFCYSGDIKGVVQTPLYKRNTLLMNPFPDARVTLRVPPGHVIMVSFPGFEEMTWCVALCAEDKHNASVANVCPDSLRPPHAEIYASTSPIRVQLYSNISHGQEGFQLSFSYHAESSSLRKLPDNSWNCSVPNASDFLYHLSCNMEVECHDAEDEMNCSYTTDRCGLGYLTLGRACFFYVRRQEEKLTSLAASGVCARRGDRLAILNTVAKWKDAVRVLPFSKRRQVQVFVGIRNALSTLRLWYSNMHQWVDETTAFYLHSQVTLQPSCRRTCGLISITATGQAKADRLVLSKSCQAMVSANVLCEKQFPPPATHRLLPAKRTNRSSRDTAYVECPSGHYVHRFLACDVKSSCWSRAHSSRCQSSQSSFPASFACISQAESVPYTLVCDHRADCADGSDEDFCRLPPCRTDEFSCDRGQCISSARMCDGWEDCSMGQDEQQCTAFDESKPLILPPALVKLSDRGRLVVLALRSEQEGICPHTHVQCSDNGYCLPMFLRCNGVYDCPGREDEADCDACPGFFRCRASKVCLLGGDLCDGHAHCPQRDDELMCDATCPLHCVCLGMAFFCKRNFSVSTYPLLRHLDASGSGITPAQLTHNYMLIHLVLANCSLTRLDGLHLPNLLRLDIQNNLLSTITYSHLSGAPQLRELSAAANPLRVLFKGEVEGGEGLRTFPHMLKLELSRVLLPVFDVTALSAFPNLQVLNLSQSGVRRVQGEGFSIMEELRLTDLRGCPMTELLRGMFQGLVHLQRVYAGSYKVCCPAVLPLDFNARNCFAPSNEISSCEDLLRGRAYSACVFLLSAIAIVGNAVSFIFRTCVSKRENKLGFGNFVTHLSVSDFVMGVYLAIIGVADVVYRDTYLWNDTTWRHGVACTLAGFLSLLSSEVSALIMCLITLDRFLVLQFPFSRLRFSPCSAHAASIVVWIGGVCLVSVPLLPVTSHWEFYSQTSICIPLPITRRNFPGHTYSFSIMIVFNFILFVFISLGQFSIYWSVRANAMAVSNTTKKTKDLTIARRLITVAMTDFVCWFPIGVLGLMASEGVPIPGEVNVAVAIFVLPLNSAVNPCLYTFNVIMEGNRRAQEKKLREILRLQLKAHS